MQTKVTTIELVFRDYGRNEDLKAEELTEAFGRVAPLRLSPIWAPMAGSLYDFGIVITFIGQVLATELVKAAGIRIYNALRAALQQLTQIPKLSEGRLQPYLIVSYDDISLEFGHLSSPGFEALPELVRTVAWHLSAQPLTSWRVRSIIFNVENAEGVWSTQDPSIAHDGLGRHWALVASLEQRPPGTPLCTHIYDATERTIEELTTTDMRPRVRR